MILKQDNYIFRITTELSNNIEEVPNKLETISNGFSTLKDGTEILIAIYDVDFGKFIPVD